MYPALDGRLTGVMWELSSGWPSGGRGRVAVRPGSDAELFMSQISASESITNVCFNLERLSRSSRLSRPGISTFDLTGDCLM